MCLTGKNYSLLQPVKTTWPTTLPATDLRPSFSHSDCQTGNGTMHFLKSCTAANELSRKRLLWKLFKINITAVIPRSSLASTAGCFSPPNGEPKANWIMKGYSTHCQNYISHLFFFSLSVCPITHMHTDYTLAVLTCHSWGCTHSDFLLAHDTTSDFAFSSVRTQYDAHSHINHRTSTPDDNILNQQVSHSVCAFLKHRVSVEFVLGF